MGSNMLDIGVIIIASIAVLLAVLSIYVSRVFLPRKMKDAYVKAITALAAAVETKDMGSVGHAKRVAELAVGVAKRLNLSNHEIERIEYAALLMDIGKANVPQRLLVKTDPLQPEEWGVIQSHSKLGAEIVAAVPFLSDLADYILHHHEYWDGSGYPDGLSREEIPLASRILCVVADYGGMVSVRPYHLVAHTPEEALDEIRRGVGTKYDPDVAAALIDLVNQRIAKGAQSWG